MSTILVYTDLNTHKELVAFQAGGYSLRAVMTPVLLCVALLCCANLFLQQWGIPRASAFIDTYQGKQQRAQKSQKRLMQSSILPDRSVLLYRSFDQNNRELRHVFWLTRGGDIWKIKKLIFNETDQTLVAYFVDYLVSREGKIEKMGEFDVGQIQGLSWESILERKEIQIGQTEGRDAYKKLPLWTLGRTLFSDQSLYPREHREILARFLRRAIDVVLPLLVFIAVFPFCVEYRKNLPFFFIYAFGLFGLVGYIGLFDGLTLIAEKGRLPAELAIASPFILLFGGATFRFFRKVVL